MAFRITRLPGSIDAISIPTSAKLVAASLLWIAFAQGVSATGVEPAKDLRVDPALCLAAALARDDDKTVAACGALIDNAKTEKADRIKALIARGAAYERKDMTERAIADYDGVLRLDPSLADIHNTRGELWRKKGDLPKAVADFAAAIKLNPDHIAARANHRALAQELERLGALQGGRRQAELQLRHRPPQGGKGDLRQSRARRSRSRGSGVVCQGSR